MGPREAAGDRLAGRLGEPDLSRCHVSGPRTARVVHAVAEPARRFAPPGTPFEGSKDVVRYFRRRIAHEEREFCYALALDTRHHLLREAMVSAGGLNGTAVELRDVFAPVVLERAASAIVIPNHPSSLAEASDLGVLLAIRLKRAADALGVTLLDFVIVARDGSMSFADVGLLADEGDVAAHRIVRHRRYRPTTPRSRRGVTRAEGPASLGPSRHP